MQIIDIREIEAERKALGVSAEALAKRAGIAASTWSRIINGKFQPRQETVIRILAALKVLRERAGKASPRPRAKKKPNEARM